MTARMMVLTFGAILGLAGPSLANGDWLPLRVNVNWQFRVRLEHQTLPPWSVAPWYMWWPADATDSLTQHDFQSSPYPTWPGAMPQGAGQPPVQGQLTNNPRQIQYQPNLYQPYPTAPNQYRPQYQPSQPIPLQPVGYPPAQVPSYWYGR